MRALCAVRLILPGLLLAGAVVAPPASGQPPAPATVVTAGGEVTILADRLEEIGADDLVIATGNVEITRGSQRLLADRVELNRATGDAVAEGRAIFYDGEDRLVGERIEYNFKTGTGVVHEGSAHTAPFYRVDGRRMERLGEGRYRVRRGLFTTCEDDPPTWSFRFGTADADLGTFLWGTNASFWVKNAPLIPFFPFFAAAIRRERQTGFLFPRFGVSSRKGMFAEIPFFWAISDSQDATITLDAYAERGVGANLAYRYVLSRTHRGSVSGFYLYESGRPEDQQEGFDEHRAWWRIEDAWTLGPGLTFRADINGVSDDFVFREYTDRLHDRSLQRAESNVFLTKSWATWNLVGSLFWYQDLTQRRPVELNRLPEVRLEGLRQPLPGLPGVLYEVESSAVNFVRAVGADGIRLDVRPLVTRPIPVLGAFTISPFVGGRLTGYDKTATGTRITSNGGLTVQETADEAQARSLYEVGADLEMRATRVWELGGARNIEAVQHVVEPRLNYTRLDGTDLVRYRRDGTTTTNQLPQYDAIDALPEASRFTYSLTNRVRARTVAPPGTEAVRWEMVRFVLAHSYEALNPHRPLGPITTDLIVNPIRIVTFRGDTSYSVYGNEGLQSATTDVALDVPRVKASLGTRYNKPDRVNFLQGNLSAELTSWVVGRLTTNWDLRADVLVENRVGVDLKWQCWAFTVEFISRHQDEDEVRFAVNLLGVGAPITTGAGLGTLGLGGAR
ncbi:MAG: LPS-assembly protein LptD [Candidatus Rokuibacteriota bacterium]